MPDPGFGTFGLAAPGTGQRLPNHGGPNAEGPPAAWPRRVAPLHRPLLRHTNQRSLRSLASRSSGWPQASFGPVGKEVAEVAVGPTTTD